MQTVGELYALVKHLRDAKSKVKKRGLLAETFRNAQAPGALVSLVRLLGADMSLGLSYALFQEAKPIEEDTRPEREAISVSELDATLHAAAAVSGPGSHAQRVAIVKELVLRLHENEREMVRDMITGSLRIGVGALEIVHALAQAFGQDPNKVKREYALSGSLEALAEKLSNTESNTGTRVMLFVPILPMLAEVAEDTRELTVGKPLQANVKLDGVRVQVHREGDRVAVFSRKPADVTAKLTWLVAHAKQYRPTRFILDGEVIAMTADGKPAPFQDTFSLYSRTQTHDSYALRVKFFDLLVLDDEELLNQPLRERWSQLQSFVPAADQIETHDIETVAQIDTLLEQTLAQGHEGLVVKDLESTYEVGKRSKAWRKLKRTETLDLVILAAEWGSGRRKGYLSNLHLGAYDPEGQAFVMLGKTFKGLTDVMLKDQTERLLALETHREEHVVFVRPELVVEVAFMELQRSEKYPAKVALRLARIKRFRFDRDARSAATVAEVLEHAPQAS